MNTRSESERKKKLQLYDFDEFARQELTFHLCQSGYQPDSVKEIIVWTRSDFEALNYRLVASSGPQPVQTGSVRKIGENIWDRIEWLIDLSGFSREGAYHLEVSTGADRKFVSPEFKIDRRCYDILLEKAARHFFLKRCGIFCHTHDAFLRSVDPEDFGRILGRRDVTGGWHDAHDDNKWVVFVWHAVYGLCEVFDKLRPDWKAANEPLPYPLSEAWWEVEWLLKMQKEDGGFYHAVLEWYPAEKDGRKVDLVHTEYCVYDDLAEDQRYLCDVWGENEVCRLLGRELNTSPSTPEKYHIYLAAAIAYFGRLAREFSTPVAERCFASVQKTLHWLEKRRIPETQYIDVQSGLALIKMEQYLDCRKEALLDEAEKHLAEVLKLQQPEGHFHASGKCRGLEMFPEETDEKSYVFLPLAYVTCLVRYLERFPERKLAGDVRKALTAFCDLALKLSSACGFGQMPEMNLNNPAVIIPQEKTKIGYHIYLCTAAYILIATGKMLGVRRYRDAGEKQLQWVFGANPRAMCFMNDEGWRNSGQYPGVSNQVRFEGMTFYRHNRDMRWGMTTGLYGSRAGQPENYPNAGLSGEHGYDSHAQETWVGVSGWFLMAATQLIK